jgi:SAM-dependent methyltransferase
MFQNAEAYERIMGQWSRRLAPLLIRFGGLTDGDRVLDVGCGTGSLSFALPDFAKVAAITGVDLVQGYVEFARTRSTDPRPGQLLPSLSESTRATLQEHMRRAYIANRPDGSRSFACVAWACRGIVPQ